MKIKIAGHYFTAMTVQKKEQGLIPFPVQVLIQNETPIVPEEGISLRAGDSPDQVAQYMSEAGVWNAVQDDPDVNSRLFLAANLIQRPQNFLLNPSKEILTPDVNSSLKFIERRWKFRSTSEKEFVMSMMERYVQDIPGAKGIASTLLSIGDELFTNALFNGPFGDLDSTLDRSTVVVLDPEMSAEIIIGHTIDRVFIGCLDSFGTLSCENLLERIYRGFNAGINNSVNMEFGGAGIGILRMVDLSADIYVIVEENKKTLVGCSFVLKRSPKKIRQTGKSFHFQSFQTIESPSCQMRIERRGHRAALRLFGDMNEDFPFGEIDLTGIDEVSLDLRGLQMTQPQTLRVPIEILKNTSGLNKIFLEYVPQVLLQGENISLISESSGEIRSLCLPLFCGSCKFQQDFFFVRDDSGIKDAPAPECPQCHKPLDAKIV